MHGLWCPQRHRCSPGSALSGAAGRWVLGRAGRRAPQWVTAPRSLPPALAPPPCSPLFQLMRGRPRALPHRRRAGNPRRHPRESHSGYGHSGQGGRSTRSRRPDSGGGDARPLGTPQWVHSGRACTTVTRARRRTRRQARAWSNGPMFNGRMLGRRERGASALSRRMVRPHPPETGPLPDGASR
jgi:hypothetical protein